MGNTLRKHRMNPYWEHFAPFDLKRQDFTTWCFARECICSQLWFTVINFKNHLKHITWHLNVFLTHFSPQKTSYFITHKSATHYHFLLPKTCDYKLLMTWSMMMSQKKIKWIMNNKMKPVMNNLKAKISKTVGYIKKKVIKNNKIYTQVISHIHHRIHVALVKSLAATFCWTLIKTCLHSSNHLLLLVSCSRHSWVKRPKML